MYTSWNTATRLNYGLPRNSHRYLIEPITKTHHVKTLLCARFVKFHESVISCKKPAGQLLAKPCKDNLNTVYGSNLNNIAKECNISVSELNSIVVKMNMIYRAVDAGEEWRIPFLQELLKIKFNEMLLDNFDSTELDDMIEFVSTT